MPGRRRRASASNLQQAYDLSTGSPVLVTLDATDDGIVIRGSASIGAPWLGVDDGAVYIFRVNSGQVLFVSGALAAPGIAFVDQATMGMYRGGANLLRLTADGASYLEVGAGTGFANVILGVLSAKRTGGNQGVIDAYDADGNISVRILGGAANTGIVGWALSGTVDAEIKRTAANELTLTNGSTGKGRLLLKRLYTEDTALGLGDFALSAGWGATAAVSAISGDCNAFEFTITANGAGLAANPTCTVTIPGGDVGDAPFAIASVEATTGSGFTLATRVTTTCTDTTIVLTTNGTPVAADTIKIRVLVSYRK